MAPSIKQKARRQVTPSGRVTVHVFAAGLGGLVNTVPPDRPTAPGAARTPRSASL
jgi:hypothetical protein